MVSKSIPCKMLVVVLACYTSYIAAYPCSRSEIENLFLNFSFLFGTSPHLTFSLNVHKILDRAESV